MDMRFSNLSFYVLFFLSGQSKVDDLDNGEIFYHGIVKEMELKVALFAPLTVAGSGKGPLLVLFIRLKLLEATDTGVSFENPLIPIDWFKIRINFKDLVLSEGNRERAVMKVLESVVYRLVLNIQAHVVEVDEQELWKDWLVWNEVCKHFIIN